MKNILKTKFFNIGKEKKHIRKTKWKKVQFTKFKTV